MLSAELGTGYIVYPSWARSFSFTWDRLPQLLEKPLESGYIDVNARMSIRSGFLLNHCGEWKLISGAKGNGIIIYKKPVGKSWLGRNIFFDESQTRSLRGQVHTERTQDVAGVAAMVLMGDAGLRFYGEGKRKPREFECCATIEHLDEAGDEVYWVVDIKTGRQRPDPLEFESSCQGFPVSLERVDEPPAPIRDATNSWFDMQSYQQCWWRITSEERGGGMLLSLAAYAAFAWNEVLKGKLDAIHVIAQVEREPRSRPFWKRHT